MYNTARIFCTSRWQYYQIWFLILRYFLFSIINNYYQVGRPQLSFCGSGSRTVEIRRCGDHRLHRLVMLIRGVYPPQLAVANPLYSSPLLFPRFSPFFCCKCKCKSW